MKIKCPNCKKKFEVDDLDELQEKWKDEVLTKMDYYVFNTRMEDLRKPIRKSNRMFR